MQIENLSLKVLGAEILLGELVTDLFKALDIFL